MSVETDSIDSSDYDGYSDYLEYANWMQSVGLWDGRHVTIEEAPDFQRKLEARLQSIIFSLNPDTIEFQKLGAMLARFGATPEQRPLLERDIQALRLTSEGMIVQAGFKKWVSKLWKNHKTEILIGAGVIVVGGTIDEKISFEMESVDQDSDSELYDVEPRKTLTVFEKDAAIFASSMTISCGKQKIKGSALIKIAHRVIRTKYNELIKKANGPTKGLTEKATNGILSIQHPREWFISLGGLKVQIPSSEVTKCHCPPIPTAFGECFDGKFKSIKIYDNVANFSISKDGEEHRLHVPKDFSIKGSKLCEIPPAQTDLSYPQIVAAMDIIKKEFFLTDSQIASLQLSLLSREKPLDTFFPQQVKKASRKEIVQFLDYVNALMFGLEASGLNAALATGLMTLELISEGQLDYKTAFYANDDGGVYPYACFKDNQGTYTARKELLKGNEKDQTSPSMRKFRDNTSLSPVAVKEAILIKTWLEFKQVIKKGTSRLEQLEKIEKEISELINLYFFFDGN